MTIREMHVRVKERIDRENSQSSTDLTPGQIDLALNAASLIELERRYGIANNSKDAFEMTAKRRTELSTLHVFSPSDIEPGITAVTGEDYYGTYYYIDLNDTSRKLWILTGLDADITKPNCPKKKIGLTEVERDDLTKILTDPFYKPSYQWRRAPTIIASGSDGSTDVARLYIYTDGDFVVQTVYPSYLRFPTPVFFGGYNSLDGLYTIGDPTVSSDMPEMLHQHIVDTAAGLLTSNLQDTDLYNLTETIRSKNEF